MVLVMNTKAITDVCRAVGGQAKLYELIHVTSANVYQWCKGIRPVPAKYCPSIESVAAEFGCPVTRRDLRPDDWWLIWPELVTDEFPVPRKVA